MATNSSLRILSEKIVGEKVKISSLNTVLNEINNTRTISTSIFNTAEEGVGHFLVITQLDKANVLLFDPLSSLMTREVIGIPLTKIFNGVYFNHEKIQDDKSEFCALFCLGFVRHLLKERSTSSYFEMFNKIDLVHNDRVICEYLMSEILCLKNEKVNQKERECNLRPQQYCS